VLCSPGNAFTFRLYTVTSEVLRTIVRQVSGLPYPKCILILTYTLVPPPEMRRAKLVRGVTIYF
jgi:hypothetical protein